MVSGDDFKTDLRRLTSEMYQINMQYQIYWICKNRNGRSKYVNVLNEYINFFAPIMGALRTSVMIGLYKMYDVDRDALSITNFLKYCDNEKLISKKIASRLKNKIDKNKSIKKIRIIRNNAVGHLNWKLDIDQTYNKAGIKYDELVKSPKIPTLSFRT